jgi:hypothetical protein
MTLERNSEPLGTAMIKETDTITVIEGYDAIGIFLETIWRRHGKPADQLAFLVGSVKWADGAPVEPTTWQDWLAAVQMVASARSCKIATGR